MIAATLPSAPKRMRRSDDSISSGERASRPMLQHRVGGEERRQHPLHQRLGRVVGPAVDGGLRLARRRAWRPSASGRGGSGALRLRALARRTPSAPRGRRAARLRAASRARPTAAPAASARPGRGSRRCWPSRAPSWSSAEPGRHVGGDVGDGDPDDPAARVARIVVRLGVDGVVVVAGVGGSMVTSGSVAQVGAAGEGRRLGRFRLGFGVGRKAGRDAVGVDGDQRGGARLVLAADHLQHLAALGAIAALGVAADLGQHQVAVRQVRAPRPRGSAGCPSSARSTGSTRTSRARLAHHAEDAVGALAEPLDQPRLDLAGPSSVSKRTSSRSPRPGAPAAASLRSGARRTSGAPSSALVGPHEEVAVGVALDHVGDAHRRQAAGAAALGPAIAPIADARLSFRLRAPSHPPG